MVLLSQGCSWLAEQGRDLLWLEPVKLELLGMMEMDHQGRILVRPQDQVVVGRETGLKEMDHQGRILERPQDQVVVGMVGM